VKVCKHDGYVLKWGALDGTKYAEKWQWAWEHSCRSMYPLLGPALGASLEERDSFLQDHIKEMVKSHGIIYFIRATGRKPLE
jgi:hypothetical protein